MVILLWDVPKRKSEYIEIPNDYGYYTIDIDNGKVPDCPDIPKKARLRVRVSNTTPSQLKKAMTMIHSTYGIKEVSVTRTDSLTSQEKVRGQRITVGDVRDADYQYGLIEEYLKTNHFVDSETLLDIKKINKELNTFLPADDVNRDNFYEAVEEALDLSVYLAAYMLRLMEEKERREFEPTTADEHNEEHLREVNNERAEAKKGTT